VTPREILVHSKVTMKLRTIASALATTVLVGTLSALPSGAASSVSPLTQLKAVIADAKSELSVRVTSEVKSGSKSIVNVTDAGRVNGRQAITLTESGTSNTVDVELIAGNLYLRGNAAILSSYLALSKTTAKQLANQWFTITKSNADYAEVAVGLTIPSVMSQVTMSRAVRAEPAATLRGVKVAVLKGTSIKSAAEPAYAEILYSSIATKPLPVEVIQTYQGAPATVLFSHWNEKVPLVAPKVNLQLT
jgi:hypothetical protein